MPDVFYQNGIKYSLLYSNIRVQKQVCNVYGASIGADYVMSVVKIGRPSIGEHDETSA